MVSKPKQEQKTQSPSSSTKGARALIASLSALLIAGALWSIGYFEARPSHEVTWEGPASDPALRSEAEPAPPPKEPKPPIQATMMPRVTPKVTRQSAGQSLGGESQANTQSGAELAPLPPLPEGPWVIAERGALTGPIEALSAQLSADLRWERSDEGLWRREDAGAALELSAQREGRVTALSLSFGERGSSALMPELELLILGGGSPSMIQWERDPSQASPQYVGGLLKQELADGAARRAYYFCDYGAASKQRSLPERCVFSYEPSQEALVMGAELKPAPQW